MRDCSLVAQGRLLQTPLGVQEVTPSTQLFLPLLCSGIRAAPPVGGADGNTFNADNRSDRKHRQRLLITMVTRASFNNQNLSTEPPEQKVKAPHKKLICFLRVYELFDKHTPFPHHA